MSSKEIKNSKLDLKVKNELKLNFIIKCSICEAEFSSVLCRRTHLINIHKETGPLTMNLNELITNLYDKDILECPPCSIKFVSKIEFLKHLRNLHSEIGSIKKFKCGHCIAQFDQFDKLHRHYSILHPTKSFDLSDFSDNEDENESTCSYCQLKFLKHGEFMTHLREVHLNRSNFEYKCEKCPYKSDKLRCFQRHGRRNHTNKKISNKTENIDQCKTECRICHLKFLKREYLLIHRREIHWDTYNNQKYKCEVCSFETCYKKNLTRHVFRIHNPTTEVSNIKYVKIKKECKVCGKTLSSKHSLIRHLKSGHEKKEIKIKKLKCELCEKTYIEPHHLKRHQKSKGHLTKIETTFKSNGEKQNHFNNNSPIAPNSLQCRLGEKLDSIQISNIGTLKLTQILNEAFGTMAALDSPKERLNLAQNLQQGLLLS